MLGFCLDRLNFRFFRPDRALWSGNFWTILWNLGVALKPPKGSFRKWRGGWGLRTGALGASGVSGPIGVFLTGLGLSPATILAIISRTYNREITLEEKGFVNPKRRVKDIDGLRLTKDARAFTHFDEIWCNIVHVFNNTAANLRIEYCAFLFGKFEGVYF